jgi:16S rRNA (guanine527-N7)-methyltransferase
VNAGTPPATPDRAAEVFGERLELAERYVATLADTGISHGLIGPREAPRLWDRHVLNCAVVHPLFTEGADVADIGSGAGLPGLVLAIIRPDLHLHLIEPLQRRTVWLHRTVGELGLGNVTVHQGRAQSLWGVRRFPHVTARAVARVGELARWSLPLLHAGGTLYALKGASAQSELDAERQVLAGLGACASRVISLGRGVVDAETVVISVAVDREIGPPRGATTDGRDRPSRTGRRRC